MITAFKKKVRKSNNSLWAKQPKMEWGGWRKKERPKAFSLTQEAAIMQITD